MIGHRWAIVALLFSVSCVLGQVPFGNLDTPVNGANVHGAIGVTGWALSTVTVAKVSIYRNPILAGENGLVLVQDAAFLPGARPDVAQGNPSYPNNDWGWGTQVLTNELPGTDGLPMGNGTYTLHAIAYANDAYSTSAEIGNVLIHVDNTHSTQPFGTLDTPTQGETVLGTRYLNFGWALTPSPNRIPIDGSTITVVVDGQEIGRPVYNQFRSDIANLFPGYANSNGAVGYYYLDTTAYILANPDSHDTRNALHTISWNVTDDHGNADGIGSRWISVAPQLVRGGSNFAWYGPGTACSDSTCYSPYGVISNYDVASGTIDDVLSQMYNSGQRALRIPIYHRGDTAGTDCTGPVGRDQTMYSAGGTLGTQCLANLTNLLASIRSHGFAHVEFGLFPQAYNDPRFAPAWPANWTNVQPYEGYYQENLALIKKLRPIFVASGLNYTIDLMNEGILESTSERLGLYAKRLWADYTAAFGKFDTVGFSIPCDWNSTIVPCSRQLSYLSSIYNNNYPNVFSFHFYNNAYTSWTNAWNTLSASGLRQSWIIGETYYNDPTEALDLSNAHTASGNSVLFLLRWPLQRGSNANINPPIDFSAYSNRGW